MFLDIITDLGSIFTFLFSQLGNMANFFTTTDLGKILLGIVLFSIIVSVGVSIFSHFRK